MVFVQDLGARRFDELIRPEKGRTVLLNCRRRFFRLSSCLCLRLVLHAYTPKPDATSAGVLGKRMRLEKGDSDKKNRFFMQEPGFSQKPFKNLDSRIEPGKMWVLRLPGIYKYSPFKPNKRRFFRQLWFNSPPESEWIGQTKPKLFVHH